MNHRKTPTFRLGLAALLGLLIPLPAQALNPNQIKLLPQNTTPQNQPSFGSDVAANERWIAVGEPGHDSPGLNNVGAVHIYSAANGRLLRVLRDPSPEASSRFGSSVAIHGDLILIGQPFASGGSLHTGAAHLFRLSDGRHLRSFVAADAASQDYFGWSVALSDTTAVIGAYGATASFAESGAVYLYQVASGDLIAKTSGQAANENIGVSLAISGQTVLAGAPGGTGAMAGSGVAYLIHAGTGAVMKKLMANDGAFEDGFGGSVALYGKRAIVGAPLGHNPTTLETGAAYLFDVLSGNQIVKLDAPAWSGNDLHGNHVAINESLAVIGAPMANGKGTVRVYSLQTAQLIQEISPPELEISDSLGRQVAISGSTVIATATGDDDLGNGAGAAYLFRPVIGPMPYLKSTGVPDSAPGSGGALFAAFGDPALNDENEMIYPARLFGPANRNAGVWSNLNPQKSQSLSLRKGDVVGTTAVTLFGNPILNDPDFGVFEAILAGPGASGGRNRAVFGDNGTTAAPLIQLGDAPLGGGELVSRFLQVTQSASMAQVGIGFQLARGPSVNLANDSGILTLLNDGSLATQVREGGASPAGDLYGQFGRVGFPFNRLAFAAGLQSLPTTNAGVFVAQPGMMATLHARRGDAAPGAGGAVFSSFFGETVNGGGRLLFRATLAGPGVNARNNQGLWSTHTGALSLVARSGDAVPGMPGVAWAGFPRFWTATFGVSTQILFLARLQGAGVTAASDVSLWLIQENGTPLLLMREGDAIPDQTGARIGVIQNVVYRPDTGLYLVQTSLVGAPASSNQVLLTGNTRNLPMSASALRRPVISLRKGALFKSTLGGVTSVNSIRVGTSGFDVTGAGHKGLGTPINSFGVAAIQVIFNNGTVELMRGLP